MTRHLLAINFRDPAHPEAGGAELHLEQVLLDAVRRGWRVTWLVAGFPGGAAEAEHKGMRIVRRGTWWNFNFIVPGVLAREFSGANAPDLIIEDVNKAPCFTPWFTRVPVAVIVPHLFGTTVFREANPLIASYVVALESLIPFAYRGCRFVAISESTRDDLIARGIPGSRVSVVHCGLDHARYHHDPAVAKSPTAANHIALAQAYAKLQQPAKAELHAAEALKSDPTDFELRMFYGQLLRDQRKFQFEQRVLSPVHVDGVDLGGRVQ